MNFESDREKKKIFFKKIIMKSFLWIIQIGFVIFLAYFIVHYTLEKTTMVGASMENTLYEDDQIIIDKFSYQFSDPKRFDIIVFKTKGNEHSYYNIKRVIGLPGEKIQIENNNIYINGTLITEPMIAEEMINSGLATVEIILDENEYFVLGDNRNNSEDSRFANVGNILKSDIIGKAWIRVNNFDFVNKINIKKE